MKALIGTVVVIGQSDRVDEAATALEELSDTSGLRVILISQGTKTQAKADEQDTTIRIDGLSPDYVDNAVAWLRLSSMPATIWWRGGFPHTLDRLATLADRLVLDTEPADQAWAQAPELFARTALTDLRWSGLTRWRAAIAHMCDLPHVEECARTCRRLDIEASDRAAARLFAGWLKGSLRWTHEVTIAITNAPEGASTPLTRVRLRGNGPVLTLQVLGDRNCLEADISEGGGSRVVPLGDGSLASRFAEELGVRTRDTAFERALVSAMEIGV